MNIEGGGLLADARMPRFPASLLVGALMKLQVKCIGSTGDRSVGLLRGVLFELGREGLQTANKA